MCVMLLFQTHLTLVFEGGVAGLQMIASKFFVVAAFCYCFLFSWVGFLCVVLPGCP